MAVGTWRGGGVPSVWFLSQRELWARKSRSLSSRGPGSRSLPLCPKDELPLDVAGAEGLVPYVVFVLSCSLSTAFSVHLCGRVYRGFIPFCG